MRSIPCSFLNVPKRESFVAPVSLVCISTAPRQCSQSKKLRNREIFPLLWTWGCNTLEMARRGVQIVGALAVLTCLLLYFDNEEAIHSHLFRVLPTNFLNGTSFLAHSTNISAGDTVFLKEKYNLTLITHIDDRKFHLVHGMSSLHVASLHCTNARISRTFRNCWTMGRANKGNPFHAPHTHTHTLHTPHTLWIIPSGCSIPQCYQLVKE